MNFNIREENEIYSIYSLTNKKRENDFVYINLDECWDILRNKYNLPYDDIIIFKVEYKSPEFKIPIVEYNLFTLYGRKKLSLSSCKNIKIKYIIPINITDYEEYKYNPNDEFYYNKCYPYSYNNNTDITLIDRKN